jgi:hypothetical protein
MLVFLVMKALKIATIQRVLHVLLLSPRLPLLLLLLLLLLLSCFDMMLQADKARHRSCKTAIHASPFTDAATAVVLVLHFRLKRRHVRKPKTRRSRAAASQQAQPAAAAAKQQQQQRQQMGLMRSLQQRWLKLLPSAQGMGGVGRLSWWPDGSSTYLAVCFTNALHHITSGVVPLVAADAHIHSH